MLETNSEAVISELLAIEKSIVEARGVAIKIELDLLAYLLGVVECEISDQIDKQQGKVEARR